MKLGRPPPIPKAWFDPTSTDWEKKGDARRAAKRMDSKRRRALKKEGGICQACDQQAVSKRVRCQRCLDCVRDNSQQYRDQRALDSEFIARINEIQRGIAARRKARGVCSYCGVGPPEEGRSRCSDCLQAVRTTQRTLHAKRRSEGRCNKCWGEPLPGRVLCQRHTDLQKKARYIRGVRKKIKRLKTEIALEEKEEAAHGK